MNSRSSLAALVLTLLAWSSASAEAYAQTGPAGAVSASGLYAGDGFGGGLMVDVTVPLGALRIGGALGAGAISSDDDDRSRVFMPAALTLAVAWRPSDLWVEGRLRAGAWAGAENDGLRAGGFLAGGAFVGFGLGPNVALGLAMEAWMVLGRSNAYAFAPGLSLAWHPAP